MKYFKFDIRDFSMSFFIIEKMPVIQTPLGVAKYVLITGIDYTVDMRTVFQKMVLITGSHCILN